MTLSSNLDRIDASQTSASGTAAFDSLYAEYEADVYRYCLRLSGGRPVDAEDLAQETWLAAWRGLPGFEGRSSPRTWLFTIALRKSLDRRARHPETSLDELTEHNLTAPEADLDLRLVLGEALESLSHKLRHAVILVKVEGLTHREAAEVLGVPTGTAQFRVFAGLRQLRKALKERGVAAGLLLPLGLDHTLRGWCRVAPPETLQARIYEALARAGGPGSGTTAGSLAGPRPLKTEGPAGRTAPRWWLATGGTLLLGVTAWRLLAPAEAHLPPALRPVARGMSSVRTATATVLSEDLAPGETRVVGRSRTIHWYAAPDRYYSRQERGGRTVTELFLHGADGVVVAHGSDGSRRFFPAPQGEDLSPFRLLSARGMLSRALRRSRTRVTVLRGTTARPEEISIDQPEGPSPRRWVLKLDPLTQRFTRIEATLFVAERRGWVVGNRSVLTDFEYDLPAPPELRQPIPTSR